MQAALPAFPALRACEYEQGFDFSLSTLPNLNTLLLSLAYKPQTNKLGMLLNSRQEICTSHVLINVLDFHCTLARFVNLICYYPNLWICNLWVDKTVPSISELGQFSLRPFCLIVKDQELQLNIYFFVSAQQLSTISDPLQFETKSILSQVWIEIEIEVEMP